MSLIKQTLLAFALSLVSFASMAATRYPSHPATAGLVNDFVGILSAEQKTALEKDLRSFESSTKVEFVVVTTPSLDGMSVEEYANGLFNFWGIGKAGADNGVLLIFAPVERKVRIEVGRRLEAILTDAESKMIISQTIVPLYRGDKQSEAIIAGANAVIAKLTPALDVEGKEIMSHATTKSTSSPLLVLALLGGVAIFVGFAVIIFIFRSRPEPLEDSLPEETPVFKERRAKGSSHHEPNSRADQKREDSSPVIVSTPSKSRDDDSYKPDNSSPPADSGISFGGGISAGGGASGDL